MKSASYEKKEQVGERSTVCSHRYADCLLKNTYTKDNKYAVNQKLEHVFLYQFQKSFWLQMNECSKIHLGIIYITYRITTDKEAVFRSRFVDSPLKQKRK